MKYYLATEAQARRLKSDPKCHGLVAVVTDDFSYLIRIENIILGWNLTPWIRRRDSVAIDVLQRLKEASPAPLKPAEMRVFTLAARKGPASEPVDIRIHAQQDRYIVHAALKGRIAARTVQSVGALKALLTRLRLKYHTIQITLIATDLKYLSELFHLGMNAGIVFELERLQELRPRRERSIREVLIFTNIAGSPLPQLEENLDFWSKGLPGYRFRHVFGRLTQKRVESVITLKEWDCLIYRGHGVAEQGAVAWQLADGVWPLPPFTSSLYLHMACLTNPQALRLECLATGRMLTPLKPVEDFDDAALVRLFLERYKISGSLLSAIRSLQLLHPQFVYLSTAN